MRQNFELGVGALEVEAPGRPKLRAAHNRIGVVAGTWLCMVWTLRQSGLGVLADYGGHGSQPGEPVALRGVFPGRERAVVCVAVGLVGGLRDAFEVVTAHVSMMPETVGNGRPGIFGW